MGVSAKGNRERKDPYFIKREEKGVVLNKTLSSLQPGGKPTFCTKKGRPQENLCGGQGGCAIHFSNHLREKSKGRRSLEDKSSSPVYTPREEVSPSPGGYLLSIAKERDWLVKESKRMERKGKSY